MSTSSGLSRTLSCKSRTARSTSPIESLLRRTKSVRETKREQSEEDHWLPSASNGSHLGRRIRNSALPRLFETPVRLITQSSLSLSLPKLHSRNLSGLSTTDYPEHPTRERNVSPPRPDAQLWKSRSVRRPVLGTAGSTLGRIRNVHFHVTSCTRCLSRGTTQCYCNYVPRLTTDFFTLASSYPRLPDNYVSSRYSTSSLPSSTGSSRRSPTSTSMSSLSQAYGGHYERRSSSLPRPRSATSIDRIGLLY